jgi:hypothetical protein
MVSKYFKNSKHYEDGMTSRDKQIHWPFILIVAITLSPTISSACAVCFGNAESAMVQGTNIAIITLLSVTGSVLGAIVAFALRMKHRSKLLERYKGNGQAIKSNELKGSWF